MSPKLNLSAFLGKTFLTLGHKKLFDIVDINEKHVIVKPHVSGIERPIKLSEIQSTYEKICIDGSMNLKGVRSFSEFSPVYIAAIVAELPDISFTNKPIVLKHVSGL